VTPTRLGFDEYDIATQICVSHHYWAVDGELEVFSAPFRYMWPSELDLMARLAGMTLRERWAAGSESPTRATALPTSRSGRNALAAWSGPDIRNSSGSAPEGRSR